MFKRKDSGMGIGDVDKDKSMVVGYASAFGNKDAHGDIIDRGAFKRTINNNAKRVKTLMHHDPVLIVGKPTSMSEDERGLYTETQISKTAQGQDLLTLIEDGVIDEMSIGFIPVQESFNEERGANVISEIKLVEYSFVTLGSNPEARVEGLKGLAAANEVAESMKRMEKALRDGRFVTDEVPEALEFIVKYWRSLVEVIEKDDVIVSNRDSSDGDTHARDDDPADATRSEVLDAIEQFRYEQEILSTIQDLGKGLGGR